jgi:two-component system, chemotaxis family, protein-glutamate methylesterase/glutaminase
METKQVMEATCPDCRGPLSEVRRGELREYSCVVGHKYSARSLLEAHSDRQESALWQAMVALTESAEIVRFAAPQLPVEVAGRLQKQAELKLAQAAEIRKILEKLEPFQVE